jgi:GTPase SAR1 family protein
MPFYEVSAKDGTNIAELFEKIGREAYDKIKKLG